MIDLLPMRFSQKVGFHPGVFRMDPKVSITQVRLRVCDLVGDGRFHGGSRGSWLVIKEEFLGIEQCPDHVFPRSRFPFFGSKVLGGLGGFLSFRRTSVSHNKQVTDP